jgi:predicted transcriptional regulator
MFYINLNVIRQKIYDTQSHCILGIRRVHPCNEIAEDTFYLYGTCSNSTTVGKANPVLTHNGSII